jgi:hypothetical protein
MILFYFKEEFMLELVIWLIMIGLIYLFYELFVIRKSKALENMKNGRELTLLKRKYKLDYNKLDIKKVVRLVGITNAFIISTIVTLVYLLQNWITNTLLWMLAVIGVGIILLIPSILIFYSMIGKSLARKQGGN